MQNTNLSFKLILLLSLTICSCSSSNSPAPGDLVEVKSKSSADIDLPEQELFTNAKRQYQNSLQSISRESFRSLKNNFPTGPYVEYAELKIADTFFANSEYAEALKAYEDYSKNRPTSPAVPYAIFKAGRSAELSSAGVGRDPNPFQRALTFYEDLLTRFPNSVYAAAARQRKTGVKEILAEYDIEVILFYRNQGKDQIAEARLREFEKNYEASTEDYQFSGYDKREPLTESLVSKKKLLEAKAYLDNLSETADKPSLITPNNVPIENKIIPENKFIVSTVLCNKKNQIATFSLSPTSSIPPVNLKPEKKGPEIQLQVENLTTFTGKNQNYSCFAEGDLSVEPDGMIRLNSEVSSSQAFFAENPARIILSLTK